MYEAVKRHRKKRRAEGKCGYNGCKEQSGDTYYCAPHAAGNAAATKKYRLACKQIPVAKDG